jgi:polyisoprenoid-binding protein YceI
MISSLLKTSVMKKILEPKLIARFVIAVLLVIPIFLSPAYSQTKYQAVGGVKITIEGTSNIHDWEMNSDKGAVAVEFNFASSGIISGLSSLTFTLPVESLKSEHKSMDKNTYNALRSNDHSNIVFTASTANITFSGNSNQYHLTAKGKLTISGVTKDVVLNATGVVNPDKSITYTGTHKLKMTDYNVKPPSLMLGAIKTGSDITVKFNLTVKHS